MMRIAVAIDAARASELALRAAVAEARAHGGSVDVVYVYRATEPVAAFPSQPRRDLDRGDPAVVQRRAQKALDTWLDGIDIDTSGVEVNRVVLCAANTARTLIERSADYDLMCIGSRRVGVFRDLRPTVVSEQVARRAHCSVLIARGPLA
ncbi:hypothetical protein GCM10027570_51790 [Streptomonospora sediminis]